VGGWSPPSSDKHLGCQPQRSLASGLPGAQIASVQTEDLDELDLAVDLLGMRACQRQYWVSYTLSVPRWSVVWFTARDEPERAGYQHAPNS
jgi:hypothetical protein